ncbi:immune inhibitor A [Candidatus Woesearchaeota archaeon]|nr:immune inhibitor A [Candidatus Woesearchaeota archaeon]
MATVIFVLVLMLISIPNADALGLGTFEREFNYTADQTSSLLYYIVKQPDELPLVYLNYSGELEDYVTFRIDDNYWYSTRLDELDVSLQRAFNLTGVTAANLTFYTKYDVEYGWDFGYVELSTDDGASWVQLNGTGTTDYRDVGAYVGFDDAEAYTGSVGSWTFETMNLTPYVGNDILIRFRYITDSYYSEHGWLVDDISIAAIGFSDDIQSGNSGWNSTGWVMNVMSLDSSAATLPIYLDFVIPDSYVSSGGAERLIVSSIPGVDADFNPTQSSAQRVIATLPPLVKYTPPAPVPAPELPSGGGRGGGGSVSTYNTYTPVQSVPGQSIVYFAPVIPAQTPHTISGLPPDTPLRSIILRLSLYTKNAKVILTPLDAKPVSIKHDVPGVYRFFEITAINLYEGLIESATFEISVPKSWLSAQRGSRDDITLTRYALGRWTDLPTYFTREDSSNYYYTSTTPGFSTFAVRLKSQLPPPNITKPVPTGKPNISQVKPITYVAGNQSPEEALQDIKEELVAKSKVTEEELEAIFPEEESPAMDQWLPLIISIPVAIIILGIGLILQMKKKKSRAAQTPQSPPYSETADKKKDKEKGEAPEKETVLTENAGK